jgi:hypothetical protein
MTLAGLFGNSCVIPVRANEANAVTWASVTRIESGGSCAGAGNTQIPAASRAGIQQRRAASIMINLMSPAEV